MDLGGLFIKKEVMMVLTCSVSDKEVRMGSRYGNVLKLQRTGWLSDQMGCERERRDSSSGSQEARAVVKLQGEKDELIAILGS